MKTIAVIGLGEVGGYYTLGLVQGGARVKAFDIRMTKNHEDEHFSKYEKNGVHLAWSMEELLEDSDMVLSVTTAAAAIRTAESAKPFLKKGQIYVEFNSAVPTVKEEIQVILQGVDVVDATTMASAAQLKHKTPINISGSRGKETSDVLNQYGMCTAYIGEKVGQASALKVLRSIFMKGFETSLVECMYTAHIYGISQKMMQSIMEFFETKPMEELLNMFITTDAIHAQRRGDEMEAICNMLKTTEIERTMTQAAANKLHWIGGLGLQAYFENTQPKTWTEALLGMEKCCNKK